MFSLEMSAVITFALLTLAILSVFSTVTLGRHRLPLWLLIYSLSILSALYAGILDPGALGFLALMVGLSYAATRTSLNLYIKVSSGVIFVVLVCATFLHKLPYFNNAPVFVDYVFGSGSKPFTQYLNFDKGSAGLIMLAFFGGISTSWSDFKMAINKIALPSLITVIVCISAALMSGYIAPEPHLTVLFLIWGWGNLLTCVAEEMLFRGIAQQYLVRWSHRKWLKLAAVVFVGALFGLAHIAGGVHYAILAAIAGTGYGYAYYRTGRIETAILTHFALNAVHFLFFTYPVSVSVQI